MNGEDRDLHPVEDKRIPFIISCTADRTDIASGAITNDAGTVSKSRVRDRLVNIPFDLYMRISTRRTVKRMRDERDENEGLPILIFMADGMDIRI